MTKKKKKVFIVVAIIVSIFAVAVVGLCIFYKHITREQYAFFENTSWQMHYGSQLVGELKFLDGEYSYRKIEPEEDEYTCEGHFFFVPFKDKIILFPDGKYDYIGTDKHMLYQYEYEEIENNTVGTLSLKHSGIDDEEIGPLKKRITE